MQMVRENMECRLTTRKFERQFIFSVWEPRSTPFFEENNMIQNRFRRLAPLAVVMFAICIAPLTTHASWVVNVGNTIKLTDGPGTLAGEFKVGTSQPNSGSSSNASTGNFSIERFRTFCVQTNEYFSYGETLTIQNISMNSQAGGQALASNTSALYRTFMNAYEAGATGVTTLIGSATYDFGAGNRASDANLLQQAIWKYQGFAAYSAVSNKFTLAVEALNLTAMAVNLSGAELATYGGVKIMNLYRADGSNAQDQLYYGGGTSGVPPVDAPEPATMLLFGLGAIGAGFVRRRRI